MKSAHDEATKACDRSDALLECSVAEVTRELVRGTMSRRQVLRWIGGLLAGAVLARFPGSASAARVGGLTEPLIRLVAQGKLFQLIAPFTFGQHARNVLCRWKIDYGNYGGPPDQEAGRTSGLGCHYRGGVRAEEGGAT